MAAIIESLTSAGCEVMKRSRATPSTSATALSRAPKSRPPTGQRYAFTVCPRSSTSTRPLSTAARTSVTMSSNGLDTSRPRVVGTMQNVQFLLQPSMIVT